MNWIRSRAIAARAGEARARQEAERADQHKTQFLANVSHEIRTPMNGILGLTTLVLDSELSRQTRDDMEKIDAAGKVLLDLVNDLLDFSRHEAVPMQLRQAPLDLARVVTEVVDVIRPACAQRGITLRMDLAADLPAHVVGDAARLRQVLMNLLANAEKFSDHGGEVVARVARDDAAGPSALRFTIADQGIGIAADALHRIFEAFEQEDGSMTRARRGTGLGLTIVRQIVEVMGGRIDVTSEKGRGSTFTFSVPLPACAPAPDISVRVSGAAVAAGSSRGRVLIVEDNAVNLLVAQRMVRRLGYDVETAPDGEAALARLATSPFSAVLMDCQMPVMDGYNATAALRAREAASGAHRMPIIAVTAHAMENDRARCLAAGMDDFLAKPIAFEELRGVLARWTPQGEAGRQAA